MKIRIIIKAVILMVVFLNLTSCKQEKLERPNVVFFLSDDQSKHDVGCYGNNAIRTPNIDNLAADGMRFNRAYTTSSMCAPSRNSLYTGLYPHRNGCYVNHGETNKDIKTLAKYLSELDYRTALAGKRHIKPESIFPFEYLTDEIKEIEQFITKDETPFCLVFASNDPHAPHETGGYLPEDVFVPPYKVNTSETRKRIADYYTDIDNVDKELGEITDLLKKHNLEDNTIVFFASDHGYGLFAKWSCYEAGLNVPFIVKWPGKIKAGSVSDAMVSFIDFVPTTIELAGGTEPSDLDGKSFLDVLINNKKDHHEYIYGNHTNRGIFSGETYPIRSVRNNRYKYIRNLYPEGKFTCIPTSGYDYSEKGGLVFESWKEKGKTDSVAEERVIKLQTRPSEELYDLENDPYELNNLIDNAQLKVVLNELRTKLDEWMEQQGDDGLEAELRVPQKAPLKNKVD